MPGKSEAQRGAAGAALAAKRGKRPVSSLQGPSLQMYRSMSQRQLSDFARKPQGGKRTSKK